MKFPFLFKPTGEEQEVPTTTTAAAASWQWPSCGALKTLSFRAPVAGAGDILKTMNSAFDTTTEQPEFPGPGDPVEAVISGLRTAERLFFEPGETSSILGELKKTVRPDKEESSTSSSNSCGGVLVAMDSMDPYEDFKSSMEEMVETHGMKDLERLEELLGWYLEANGKENHGYIVGAFVDLLIGLAFTTTTTTTTTTFASATASSSSSTSSDSDEQNRDRSFSVVTGSTRACSLNSPLSFSSSVTSSCSTTSTSTPCLSSLEADQDEIDKTVDSSG